MLTIGRFLASALAKIDFLRSTSLLWSVAIGALAAVMGALAGWLLLGGAPTKLGYLTFYPVVALAGLTGGLAAGTLATVLGAILAHSKFVPLMDAADWLGLVTFITGCAIVLLITEALQRERARAAAAEAKIAQAEALQEGHAQVRESEARFRKIFENAATGIAIADWRGQLLQCNPTCCTLLGYGEDELRDLNFHDLIHPEDRASHLTHVEELRAGKTASFHIEDRFVRKDGRIILAEKFVSLLPDESGQQAQLIALFTDVTGSRHIERMLHDKQRFESLGRLTGGIAHDFNNLLTIISGNLQLVEMGMEDPHKRSYLADANRATEIGARLNQRLMTFARQRRLEPVQVDLNQLVDGLLDLVRSTVGGSVVVKTKLSAEPATILVDASEMENAILNLALNARDAMANGGTLRIESHNVELDAEAAATMPGITPGAYLRLSVTDTGVGMTKDVLARAFEPFFTTREEGEGMGLGLSTIYGFVRQSGGHASIDSELGRGTTAHIYLPIRAGTATQEIKRVSIDRRAVHGKGEVILAVEDNPAVLRLTVKRLKLLGYNVVEADSGQAALALVAAGNSIDLVFSDIIMAGGISGFELAKRLRSSCPALPILLTSGFPDATALREFSNGYEFKVLRKPYSQDDLGLAIAAALRQDETFTGVRS